MSLHGEHRRESSNPLLSDVYRNLNLRETELMSVRSDDEEEEESDEDSKNVSFNNTKRPS